MIFTTLAPKCCKVVKLKAQERLEGPGPGKAPDPRILQLWARNVVKL